jgi:hypothetical protein
LLGEVKNKFKKGGRKKGKKQRGEREKIHAASLPAHKCNGH